VQKFSEKKRFNTFKTSRILLNPSYNKDTRQTQEQYSTRFDNEPGWRYDNGFDDGFYFTPIARIWKKLSG
jgi:hypothetical protein